MHTQELADAFEEACVKLEGAPEATADWALANGFAPLPETFWERSLITKPADREVVCHASAWDIDNTANWKEATSGNATTYLENSGTPVGEACSIGVRRLSRLTLAA